MNIKENKGIISLAAVYAIGLLALGTVLTTSVLALTELTKNRNTISGNQSFHTAEAAAREGVYQYQHIDSYLGGTPQLLNNTSQGEITITDIDWPYVEVSGAAENQTTHRKIIYTMTKFAEGLAFKYSVFSQNVLNFSGDVTVNGNIFANNGIDFNEPDTGPEIYGNAFSPVEITDTDNIKNGVAVSGPKVSTIPSLRIDFQPYYDTAQAEGTLFTTSADAESYLEDQTQIGIIFIEDTGETRIEGASTNLVGCLATQGDLTLAGGNYTAAVNYPALLVQGNLRIEGGTTIEGIIYVKGSIYINGANNLINGSLISAGETKVIEITGTNTVINFSDTNWQDLTGLEKTSTQPPKIIQWQER